MASQEEGEEGPEVAGAEVSAPLFKILDAVAWPSADGSVPWAPIDRADGFVHLSAVHQVCETAIKHFADRDDLVLVEVLPDKLPEGTLKWEVSRGGDHFPHVYGDIPARAVGRSAPLSTRDGTWPDWDSLRILEDRR